MALNPGDRRLVADVAEIDDRGLEDAEALIHELRQRAAPADPRIPRALAALSTVRTLTKRGA